VRTALDLLRLALLYGPGGQSLRTLAANAAASGIANVSDVALLNRLKQAADWLETLCAESLGGIASDAAAGEERPLRIVDGSRLAGPAASAWRLHLAYDPRAGRITGARITTLEQGERLDRLPVRPGEIRPGEIRLGDRGFPKPAGIRDVLAAGADLLVRLSWKSLRLTDAADQPLDWFALFDVVAADGALDKSVKLRSARGHFPPIELRLVIIGKPPQAATRARRTARRANRKDQYARLDPRTLASADHLILLTSLPREPFTVDRLAALYRIRWQIEIAFKRLKSILHIDRLPAKNPRLGTPDWRAPGSMLTCCSRC
jgi:hypothetical protein